MPRDKYSINNRIPTKRKVNKVLKRKWDPSSVTGLAKRVTKRKK